MAASQRGSQSDVAAFPACPPRANWAGAGDPSYTERMSTHRFDLESVGAGLPVANAAAALSEAIRSGAAVVTAPPGSGKTTFVPALAANLLAEAVAPGDPVQMTLLSQPRRVAVRAAARRLATLDGSSLGDRVGFTVRGERTVGPSTRVEALTPGVLLRRLLGDPGLEGVGAVVLDEIHERSLDSDLLLGMLREVRQLRPDLLLVAMSATLDAQRTAELIDGAVVDVPAALHPLDLAYAPAPAATARLDDRGVTREFMSHVASLAVAEQRACGDDALVFVPGAREVDEVVRQCRGLAGAGVEVLPLHGQLGPREQDRAVTGRAAGELPRIVVSTALAESSLTVPGVRLVIDAGLSREVRRDRGRDMTGLVTVSCSRASAEQRAGRAAREGAGRCVRAYSETEFARMPPAVTPEILSADLTDAALTLAVWGTPGAAGFTLPTPPPASAMAAAQRTLAELELTDAAGRPTPLGTRVAGLPVGVREARALLDGAAELGDPVVAAEIVAAFSGEFRAGDADLGSLLRTLRRGAAPGADRWKREAKRLAALVAQRPTGSSPAAATHPHPSEAPGIVAALARPDWLARRTGEHTRTYLLASGTRAALPEGSPLNASEWLAVRAVQRAEGRVADGTGAVIRLAAAVTEDTALRLGEALTTRTRAARIVDGKVRVREETKLGEILLASQPASAAPADTGPAFAAHLRAEGLEALSWSPTAAGLRARMGLLHRELGAPWPAVDDDSLLASVDSWLGTELARLGPGATLGALPLAQALRALLPWPEAASFDALAPETFTAPSGSHVRIDYPSPDAHDARPVVALKLQELFGLADTPRIVAGRVPLLFHLLSPARQPLAVTDDLRSFWDGPYQDVRKQMRGRYPRHPWPEDPWTAEATSRTNRALAARAKP